MERAYPYKVAIIGGDARQIEVARALGAQYQEVRVFGHPPFELPDSVRFVPEISQAINDAKIIVLPISGMDDSGMVRSYQATELIDFGSCLPELSEDTLIVTGQMTSKWLKTAAEKRISVLQYADDDRIAILNSIPTAEGAAQIAMEGLPITIHGSVVLVIGFGRVGVTTARVFKALGARVIVAARRQASLARAYESNYETVLHRDLVNVIGSADLIINTVPALVLGKDELAAVSPEALIIDLASPPGGTDFAEAERLKLKAILAPGLPGKVAPKTAGKILASAIPEMIADWIGGGGK
ncbi:MAG: dipicolinate synthase subunit DpsA [Firmicutes bacterium]|nr:dipicolinate synthase subunit DpsA [Bacillota bacterium]